MLGSIKIEKLLIGNNNNYDRSKNPLVGHIKINKHLVGRFKDFDSFSFTVQLHREGEEDTLELSLLDVRRASFRFSDFRFTDSVFL